MGEAPDPLGAAHSADTGAKHVPELAVWCARCGAGPVPSSPVRNVVSARFTDVEDWVDPGGAMLCRSCTWAYRTPVLRSTAHLITRDPDSLRPLGPVELHRVLNSPLPPTSAVTVPTDGRKHLLPHARWGRIRTPDLTLTWTEGDVHRLAAMTRLRGHGFTETALAAPAPDYPTLRRLPQQVWEAVMADWATLGTWHSAPPWWQLGIRATRRAATDRRRPQPTGASR